MSEGYCFEGEWTDEDKVELKSFIAEKWQSIEAEEIDPDFEEYILLMIANKKTMAEISSEIVELGVEENKAK
jgi:hypothetical protein